MNTGEDTQGLRKIIDLTRLISLTILALHFYMSCYQAFLLWGLTAPLAGRLLGNLIKTGLFSGLFKPKLAALLFLLISLLGVRGKKEEHSDWCKPLAFLLAGLLSYFSAYLTGYLSCGPALTAMMYMGMSLAGYLLILTGGIRLTRILKLNLNKDVFNEENETFPQEERKLENEYSVNLPAMYRYKKETRPMWVNVINPFRSILVSGSAGAGKTYFVIRHIIDQHIKKGFALFVYDFKFADLTTMVYNKLLQYHHYYAVKPAFYVINFEDLDRTHRCNPLSPAGMDDITDAAEASRTILMGLNKEWLKKQGDFFVESPINFLTAIIWYLRKYRDGLYCTLPHVIELMQTDYDPLFAILSQQDEIKALINPFILAHQNNAKAQLEGQIASAKIGLARLASPQLYYVLSGDDFSLDINDPEAPKIVCMGNNPQKIQTYGAVLSLYVNRLLKLVNQKNKLKSSLIFDEYPTLVADVIPTISTARSNLVAVTLGIQSIDQVKKEYGSEQADIIAGIAGNIISGQVSGDSAKHLSETLGKIMQNRESLTINSQDTSVSKSVQLDAAVPASKIATLSSGEFVGIVADSPNQLIRRKMFHAAIRNDHEALKKEDEAMRPLPVVRKVTPEDIEECYQRIRKETADIIRDELLRLFPEELPPKTFKGKGTRERKRSVKKQTAQEQAVSM